MPVAKLLGSNTPDAMKVDEGNDSLDTFIRQAVGKEPLFSLSRTGDSPVQWIQFLQLDQQDLPGWPLLTPMKVQMQKCDKCAREFSSPINYRRHTRVHRRSMNFHKDTQKYRDLLGAFWDKLSYDDAKEIMSFKDVNLEDVPGSSIIWNISANLRKPLFLSLPQVYVKAGSALVDIIQGRPSRLPITSQELFSILDDASERTFLCAGTAQSLQKYVFDGEAAKIGLEMKNLIACTSFLVEQKLVKACLAVKDAEALRCQKLLVEEEEAAQKRQAEVLERKRQRKLRQKEQRVRDQLKIDVYTASMEASIAESSADVDSYIPEETFLTPLDPISNSDQSDSATCHKTKHQTVHKNGFQPYVARRQLPNSQKKRRSSFVWTKKPKSENVVGGGEVVKIQTRVQNDAVNQTDQDSCQLMIGSISVTVRNCPGQQKVDEIKENCNTALEKEVEQMLDTNKGTNHSNLQIQDGDKMEDITFSIHAAKAFLAQRWKEAASGDHVKLVLSSTSSEPPPSQHESKNRVILGSAENRLVVNTTVVGNVKPQFRTKPDKGIKTKYIPKHRPTN